MTVTNFESITKELTEKELEWVDEVVKGFAQYTEKNPIKYF